MIIDYACCFCGEGMSRTDRAAVGIALRNLWEGEAVQGLQAHARCIVEAFPTKFSMVDPDCLRD